MVAHKWGRAPAWRSAANGWGFGIGESVNGIGITDLHHALHGTVAEVFVGVVVVLEESHECGDLRFSAEFSNGDGGEHGQVDAIGA